MLIKYSETISGEAGDNYYGVYTDEQNKILVISEDFREMERYIPFSAFIDFRTEVCREGSKHTGYTTSYCLTLRLRETDKDGNCLETTLMTDERDKLNCLIELVVDGMS